MSQPDQQSRPAQLGRSLVAISFAAVLAGCGPTTPSAKKEAAWMDDLRDVNVHKRLAAARELGERKSRNAVEPLVRLLRDVRMDVRAAAIEALGKIGDPAAVEPLCNVLRQEPWSLRKNACEALGRIGDPRAIEPLAAALTDAEESVATAAAVNLGRLGPEAVPAVVKVLGHKKEAVREAAACALGRIGSRQAAAPLRALLGDPSPMIRLAAADALARIGDPAAAPLIVQLLNDPDKSVQAAAPKSLLTLGTNAVPALIQAATNRYAHVRHAAVSLLNRIGDLRAAVPLLVAAGDHDGWVRAEAESFFRDRIENDRLAGLVVEALAHTNAAVRTRAIVLLEDHPAKVPLEVAAARLAQDPESRVRIAAANILAASAETNRVVAYLVPALSDSDGAVRISVAAALAAMGDARGGDVLIAAVQNKDAPVSLVERAILALGRIREKRAVDALVSLLKYPDTRLGRCAIRALGDIGDPRATEHLVPLLRGDLSDDREGESAMKLAADALGRIRDPRAFDPLAALMNRASHRWWQPIRERAIGALAQVDPDRAVPALLTALSQTEYFDESQLVNLCRALGTTRDPRIVGPLLEVLKSDLTDVRKVAALALKETGSAPQGMKELIAQMKQPQAGRRSVIAAVLGEIGEPALPALLEGMKSNEPEIRHGCAWALGCQSDKRAVPPLIAALGDMNEHVRAAAAWALGELKDPAAVEPLLALARDPEAKPRLGAIEALGRLRDKRATDTLRAALTDEVSGIRAAAVYALGQLGDLRALDSLSQTLKDRDPAVKSAAEKAMNSIRSPARPSESPQQPPKTPEPT